MMLKILYYPPEFKPWVYLDPLFNHIPGYKVSYTEVDYIPIRLFDESRKQYKGEYVNMWLSGFREGSETILGILDIDAYVPTLNFIFGLATPSIMTASVYTPRLRYMADEDMLGERIRKEALHELGHLHGLEHCRDYRCVMSFSNSILDVDRKSWRLCKYHYRKLKESGLDIDESLLLQPI